MADEVLTKDKNGIRGRERRNRDSSVYVVEIDLSPFFEDAYKLAKEKFDLDERCVGVHTTGRRVGYVPTSKGLYVLSTEGCSLNGDEKPATDVEHIPIPIYMTFKKEEGRDSFAIIPFAEVTLSKERLLGLPVVSIVNFGEWVRKFGDRLERNFHNWNNHMTPIYDADHVQKLVH